MAAVNPYLNFNGNCEEAFNFYHAAFGGEIRDLMRFAAMPAEHRSPGEENKIMHICLPIGPNTYLMGSDWPSSFGEGKGGNLFHVSIMGESEEETKKLFTALSAGGQVTMPLGESSWDSLFGMFIDKFGVSWMINYQHQH